jgi:sodium-dependent phosphate transporter
VGLGGVTAKTVASDISNVKQYTAVPEIYMYGMLCSLTVAGCWLLFATYFRMAVSTTHSIIGSIMGFSLVFGGFQDGVLWNQETGSFPYSKGFLSIVLSWFFSPIIGGILSAIFFLFSRTLVLRRENSTSKAIFMLPVLLFFTFFINLMFVLAKGAKSEMSKTWPCFTDKGRNDLSFSNCDRLNTAAVWIAASAGLGIAIFGGAFGIWFLRRKFTHEELTNEKGSTEAHTDAKADEMPELKEGAVDRKKTQHGGNDDLFNIPSIPVGLFPRILYFAMLPFIAFYMQCKKGLFYDIHDKDMEMDESTHELHAGAEVFHPNAEKVFEFLQVISACCVAFAHGANDVANAMGPFSAVYSVYTTHKVPGSNSEAPRWIFVIGGFGIILGLLMYGYNIIGHLGTHLVTIYAN